VDLEARVTLDLTRPEHREAQRLACEYVKRYPGAPLNFSLAFVLSAEVCGVAVDITDVCAAFTALSSPSDSAALVRALLEALGFEVSLGDSGHSGGGLWWARSDNSAAFLFLLMGWPRNDAYRAIPNNRIQALILALLACTECSGVKVNGKRYGCRRNEPRIGDAPACPTCADTGIARTTEARDGALAALREAGR
jgi:hypothetical protein